MTSPIIDTKIYLPQPRRSLVTRAHLEDQLNAGLYANLCLVLAPAGSGKTTLVSAWAAASPRPVAWLSLDNEDNDPERFAAYFTAALRVVTPGLAEQLEEALQPAGPLPLPDTLTALLNAVGRRREPVILVLDDYHVIRHASVHAMLNFILEHQPPQLHLIVITREAPPFPLARLRVRNGLSELGASELRFTLGEAATFLNGVMGLGLSPEDVTALDARTEGWVAGLQLAALSLKHRVDRSAFIHGFAGNDTYVLEYLVEEILARQPEPVRRFLLHTAVLERLNGPLCDAVSGQGGGQERLESLERQNFFLVPLGGAGRWYRYHRLFAEALEARLRAEEAERVPLLHRRASTWFEQQDLLADAVRHALAGEDFERAADLLERIIPELRRDLREGAVLGWLQALPEELMRSRPALNVHYAKALLATGDLHSVEARLSAAERWLEVRRVEDRPHLPVEIAIYRAASAMTLGEVDEAERHAQWALRLSNEDDHLARGAVAGFLGLTSLHRGHLEAARLHWAEGETLLLRAGHVPDAVGAARAQADILIVQGHLQEARRTYERGLQFACPPGQAAARGAADMHVGLSGLHQEWNDLAGAQHHLQRSEALGVHMGLPQHSWREPMALAGMHVQQGNLDEALRLLEEAGRRYVPDFFPDVRLVSASRARVLLLQGRVKAAEAIIREWSVSPHDAVPFVRELAHLTWARARLASSRGDRERRGALGLLTRLEEAAAAGGRTGTLIEILTLQALAHDPDDESGTATALVPLARALELAEPEGHIRVFLSGGSRLVPLLHRAVKRGILPAYTRGLLAAFRPFEGEGGRVQPTGEGLSARELSVLKWLTTDLGGPDIARALGVSLNTLRTHTQHIYGKLGVRNRRSAVRRAQELGIL
ncbi:LuxR C-terminal-related transcriptional regulator [Deinococcus hopiensis]|uniref:LuxR C-terminal-related transcriptional regulator n=1 Tax=Deinococcus hopiensis TaxID=309885 RepID=UPI002481C314|nr:LuxR C-terminal-related transcriptional regulator [Deinococcus hopiensis]